MASSSSNPFSIVIAETPASAFEQINLVDDLDGIVYR